MSSEVCSQSTTCQAHSSAECEIPCRRVDIWRERYPRVSRGLWLNFCWDVPCLAIEEGHIASCAHVHFLDFRRFCCLGVQGAHIGRVVWNACAQVIRAQRCIETLSND